MRARLRALPTRILLVAALVLAALVGSLGFAVADAKTAAPDRSAKPGHSAGPLIFGHRGASGYRPEHTLASYDLAIRQGADVIEPDLVSTKDHQLVARHENDITGTTDVEKHPEFANRMRTKTVDGVSITGWFTEDFTLRELRTLRAEERLPLVRQENTIYDGRYQIPTFQEVIDLAAAESKRYGRTIGITPETKHPTYFDSIGLSLEEPLVATLRANKLENSRDVYVQSFETANLQELRNRFHLRTSLVQLTSASGRPYDYTAAGNPATYADIVSPAGLRKVATYADWLGPDKAQMYPRDPATQNSGAPSTLVRDAHAAHLCIVPYTVRPENQFLPAQYRTAADPNAYGHVFDEYQDLFEVGVDGLFTDTPDIGFAAREDFHSYRYGVAHPQAQAHA
ncbi:MAG TPA: glycerophosphodiester phosphodiesterase [Frankiaceae bacterium]|nr:glycerophosphodiester phosphodiesterase [Frankiaceae bacterium]